MEVLEASFEAQVISLYLSSFFLALVLEEELFFSGKKGKDTKGAWHVFMEEKERTGDRGTRRC